MIAYLIGFVSDTMRVRIGADLARNRQDQLALDSEWSRALLKAYGKEALGGMAQGTASLVTGGVSAAASYMYNFSAAPRVEAVLEQRKEDLLASSRYKLITIENGFSVESVERAQELMNKATLDELNAFNEQVIVNYTDPLMTYQFAFDVLAAYQAELDDTLVAQVEEARVGMYNAVLKDSPSAAAYIRALNPISEVLERINESIGSADSEVSSILSSAMGLMYQCSKLSPDTAEALEAAVNVFAEEEDEFLDAVETDAERVALPNDLGDIRRVINFMQKLGDIPANDIPLLEQIPMANSIFDALPADWRLAELHKMCVGLKDVSDENVENLVHMVNKYLSQDPSDNMSGSQKLLIRLKAVAGLSKNSINALAKLYTDTTSFSGLVTNKDKVDSLLGIMATVSDLSDAEKTSIKSAITTLVDPVNEEEIDAISNIIDSCSKLSSATAGALTAAIDVFSREESDSLPEDAVNIRKATNFMQKLGDIPASDIPLIEKIPMANSIFDALPEDWQLADLHKMCVGLKDVSDEHVENLVYMVNKYLGQEPLDNMSGSQKLLIRLKALAGLSKNSIDALAKLYTDTTSFSALETNTDRVNSLFGMMAAVAKLNDAERSSIKNAITVLVDPVNKEEMSAINYIIDSCSVFSGDDVDAKLQKASDSVAVVFDKIEQVKNSSVSYTEDTSAILAAKFRHSKAVGIAVKVALFIGVVGLIVALTNPATAIIMGGLFALGVLAILITFGVELYKLNKASNAATEAAAKLSSKVADFNGYVKVAESVLGVASNQEIDEQLDILAKGANIEPLIGVIHGALDAAAATNFRNEAKSPTPPHNGTDLSSVRRMSNGSNGSNDSGLGPDSQA